MQLCDHHPTQEENLVNIQDSYWFGSVSHSSPFWGNVSSFWKEVHQDLIYPHKNQSAVNEITSQYILRYSFYLTMHPQPHIHRPAGHHEGDAEVEVQPGRPDVHRLRDGHEHTIHLLRKEPRWPLVHSMSTNWGWNDQGQGYYSSSRHNITNQWSRNLRICCRPSCLKYCMPYWNLVLSNYFALIKL